MTNGFRARTAIALATTAILVLAACGGGAGPVASSPSPTAQPATSPTGSPGFDLAALEAAAKQEGSLVVYTTGSPAIVQQTKAGFEARYPGITVTVADHTATALRTKWVAELDTGQILHDIVQFGEVAALVQNAPRLIELSELPAWSSYPEKFKTSTHVTSQILPRITIFNTDRVKPGEITSWADIVDPRFKGEIATSDPANSTSTAFGYVVLQRTYGDEYLLKLFAQQILWTNGNAPAVALVAAGERSLNIVTPAGQIVAPKEAGAPVQGTDMDPQTGTEQVMAIPAGAKNPNAAKLFMNWILTSEGQEVINANGSGASVLPNIPGALTISSGYVPFDPTIPQAEYDRVIRLLKEGR